MLLKKEEQKKRKIRAGQGGSSNWLAEFEYFASYTHHF
jgi:hypothetical protein